MWYRKIKDCVAVVDPRKCPTLMILAFCLGGSQSCLMPCFLMTTSGVMLTLVCTLQFRLHLISETRAAFFPGVVPLFTMRTRNVRPRSFIPVFALTSLLLVILVATIVATILRARPAVSCCLLATGYGLMSSKFLISFCSVPGHSLQLHEIALLVWWRIPPL